MLFFIRLLALASCLFDAHLVVWGQPRSAFSGANNDTTTPPSAHKPFFCLEVEPAEDARPEVQATTIEERVTPLMEQSQCQAELLAGDADCETGPGGNVPYPFDQLQLTPVK
jgi:hypothetical protein